MRELTLQWHTNGHLCTYRCTEQHPVILGRHPACEIVLLPQTISRQHALVFAAQTVFYIRNMSASNPLYVNRQLITVDTPLKQGDTLQLSELQLYVAAIHEALPEPATFKLRCSTCLHVVEATYHDCPWCGTSLAHGVTVYT